MWLLHDFGISVEQYAVLGKNNEFPIPLQCPKCSAYSTLEKHGFYERNAITDEGEWRIPIRRLRCQSCGGTVSILPDLLLPYFQHTLHTVMSRLEAVLEGRKAKGSRQLVAFYLKRFLQQLNWIGIILYELTGHPVEPEEDRKRATKYLKAIRDFDESTFLRRTKGHLAKHFMAY